ncbi:MAG: hypothetical protein L0Z62_13835 [Gemmataceae bacterium]|nr:hypothetical protein [Gemmataceae bacterium]
MTRSLVVVWAMLAAGDVEPAGPVAMVLTTKGTVTRERGKDQQRLRAMDLLRPGDVLQAADGEAVLVLLDDGRRERLKARSRATVGAKGYTPTTAVERQENVKLSAGQLAGLRDLARSSRAGVGVLRGEPPPTPQVVTPMYSATILTAQPTFSWPPVDKADRYQVQLWSGDGQRRIWQVTTSAVRLAYPEKQPVLKPGTTRMPGWGAAGGASDDRILAGSPRGRPTRSCGDRTGGDMIADHQQLQRTLERIACFQNQVAHLRQTETNPVNYRAAVSGFLAEMDRMQLEVRGYFSFLPVQRLGAG